MGFYVYIYLDPRKPGKYKYDKYEFDYEPFYVGKGKGLRYKRIDKYRSKYFQNKINNIRKYRFEPIIELIENLDENKSFILESKLINLIGRNDLKNGPLLNFTNGGEGPSGKILSEETKRKISENHVDVIGDKNPFYRKKHSNKSRRLISDNHTNFKGENCGNSKLKNGEVWLIKKILNSKYFKFKRITLKEIGLMFNVTYYTISDIKRNKTWSHVKLENCE